jgi:FHS family L-fucose permease-like MFS transporter
MSNCPVEPTPVAAPLITRRNQWANAAPYALMYLIFGALGLAGSMIGALVPALRVIYTLDFRAAMAAQWVVLIVSGILSLPILHLMRRVGAYATICLALGTMVAGCVTLSWAVGLPYYVLVLGALTIMTMGTTALQVAGNPLTAALGSPEKSHSHLAMAQAFNALGVLVGVHLGASVMLGQAGPASAAPLASGVAFAYRFVAIIITAALGFFALGRRHFTPSSTLDRPAAMRQALHCRWAWAGALAMALYVGAEGAIGSILINFLHQPQVLNLPLREAGEDLANLYWGGALAGRFAGSWLLSRYPAPHLLLIAAAMAAGLCLLVAVSSGPVAGYAALAIGLFNSIMFPTIFSLTLARSQAPQSATSGLLCTAIAGGALISIMVGELADHIGIGQAFVVPMAAYVVIAIFAQRQPAPAMPHSGAA